MAWLSEEASREIKQEVATTVSSFMENYTKPKPRLLGLISLPDVEKELDVKYNTIKRWEENGLKRYCPPLEDSRKIYYKISDLLIFMGADKWL